MTATAKPRPTAQVDRMGTTTVAELMHPGIVSCSQAATAAEVARIMAACKVHCVAVMGLSQDERRDPLIWGIVSDLDLVGALATPDGGRTAADLAHQPVITARSTMSVRQGAQAMATYHVQHLVVVEPDRLMPVGVLSTLDVARYMAETAP